MNTTLIFFKISLIVKNLFDQKTVDEMQAMKAHFTAAYSDAQLCALVLTGLVLRVFGLVPRQDDGARSLTFVVGMLVQFLQNLQHGPDGFRAGPNPLDDLVSDGLRHIGEHV
jgi:hypothetical protein